MSLPRRPLNECRQALRLTRLPPRVAWFQWRARQAAWRVGDRFSLTSATRASDLRALLALARGRTCIVELGTATAWTAISLALGNPACKVVSYDIHEREEPQLYLALVDPQTRARIELVVAPGARGPRTSGPVDLLYIDSSHDRDETIAEIRAWRPYLPPGAVIVLDDFGNPDYPGIREAIAALALDGKPSGTMFVHTVA
jgi:predicted O-methyltransferase YrrM